MCPARVCLDGTWAAGNFREDTTTKNVELGFWWFSFVGESGGGGVWRERNGAYQSKLEVPTEYQPAFVPVVHDPWLDGLGLTTAWSSDLLVATNMIRSWCCRRQMTKYNNAFIFFHLADRFLPLEVPVYEPRWTQTNE